MYWNSVPRIRCSAGTPVGSRNVGERRAGVVFVRGICIDGPTRDARTWSSSFARPIHAGAGNALTNAAGWEAADMVLPVLGCAVYTLSDGSEPVGRT
jgi:hypothetical protein